MSVITLPSNQGRALSFELSRAEEILTTAAGVAQVTSFPDRRWSMRLEIVQQDSADLLAWNLALIQLSSRSNVFAYGPPFYSGPSTGYTGNTPLVAGADQLGTSLEVDGVTANETILSAGDYISFDTTSANGITNRQLVLVTSDVTSNTAGEATIPLAYPIRQAPENNASVNIETPTAFFMLSDPRGGVQALTPRKSSVFVLDAVERIFP